VYGADELRKYPEVDEPDDLTYGRTIEIVGLVNGLSLASAGMVISNTAINVFIYPPQI
jgi:hypothetical protein